MSETRTADSDPAGLSASLTEAARKAQERNRERIRRAIEALEEGKPEKSRALVREVLEDGRVSAGSSAYVVKLLRALGDEDEAERLRRATLDSLAVAIARYPDNALVFVDSGLVYLELEERDKAEAALTRALELDPEDMRAGLPLINIKLQKNDPEGLLAVWKPSLAAIRQQDYKVAVRSLVKGLGHFGHVDAARTLLEECRARWEGDQSSLDKLAAVLGSTGDEAQNIGDLADEFDNFSAVYDENLASIGNRGPQLIFQMIEQLGWTPDASREIFDAGCGTGLCGPYLRPFAKVLHGCDLSVGMLEKSKARNLFDLLTRTDLGNPATYPDATFTDAVSADVFVYFGDLEPVLKNIGAVLRPGGWLIFTVEDASDRAPARGWERYSSGRYRHTPEYLAEVLPKAGFTRPKQQIRDTLRHEFGTPIKGICVAAQKLAFTLG